MGILTPVELEARHDIELEKYVMEIQIEARIMGDLAKNHIIPATIEYQNKVIKNIQGLMDIMGAKEGKELAKTQMIIVRSISKHVNALNDLVNEMVEARKEANLITDNRDKAFAYCDKVKLYFDEIRYHADRLELQVDDEMWPLPKLREMLFTK